MEEAYRTSKKIFPPIGKLYNCLTAIITLPIIERHIYNKLLALE